MPGVLITLVFIFVEDINQGRDKYTAFILLHVNDYSVFPLLLRVLGTFILQIETVILPLW